MLDVGVHAVGVGVELWLASSTPATLAGTRAGARRDLARQRVQRVEHPGAIYRGHLHIRAHHIDRTNSQGDQQRLDKQTLTERELTWRVSSIKNLRWLAI